MSRLTSRPTGDLLVLMFAGTICFMVIGSGVAVVFVRVTNPTSDVSQSVGVIADIINTMLGLTAGFVAGRTEAHRNVPPSDE